MAEENKPRLPDARISDEVSALRRQAEELLLKRFHQQDNIPLQEAHLLLHELQVHQIELEMQNDELRRAQLELEASREKYFDLYDLAPVGYFSLDEKGLILEANLTAASMFGIERKQLVGQPLTHFIYREDQDLYYLCRKQFDEVQTQQVCEVRMSPRDGTPFWARLNINTARDVDGKAGTRVVIVDFSESKRLDDALKTSEIRYRLLFENMSEGSASCKMLYDKEGNPTDFVYLDVNPAFARLTGLHEVAGRNVTEVTLGIKEAHPELFEIYSRVALTGRPEKFEIELKPLAAWFAISVYSKKKDHFVVVFDNITERKQAENEMVKAKKLSDVLNLELAAVNKDLEAFSYSVSHDLRAPLRHITGYAALLKKRLEGRLDEKDLDYMALINRAANRMGTMIDDLLAFSHSGRKEMQKKRVRLGDLVSEAVRDIQDEVSERDITWTIDELPDVNGDPSLLRLAIVNLITNAVKFTKNRTKAEIEISCGEDDSEIVCFIKDNGAGFDMKQVDRLFGVFQRLHTREEFEGTGIGLANVRRILSRHGGRTWAEGSVGQGATFYFTLPKPKKPIKF